MLFGIPVEYDADGTGGLDPDGVLNAALRDVRAEVGDGTVIMSDLCIDEFTDHGHCGVLDEHGQVDNDRQARASTSRWMPRSIGMLRDSTRPSV
jgi:porphobilinogen synthase